MPPLSVLVVEDETTMRAVLTDLLVAAGHDVYGAPHGAEALRFLRTQSVDAILCDVRMPKMDGMELYDAIAVLWPDLLSRIVFVTGFAGQPDVWAFLSRTKARVIEKPPDMTALLATLQAIGRRGAPPA